MKIIKTEDIRSLPKKQGVYFLFSDSELLYIGRTNNIWRRIKEHINTSMEFKKIVNGKEVKQIAYQLIESEDHTKLFEENILSWLDTKFNGTENWHCSRKFKENVDMDKLRKRVESVIL